MTAEREIVSAGMVDQLLHLAWLAREKDRVATHPAKV